MSQRLRHRIVASLLIVSAFLSPAATVLAAGPGPQERPAGAARSPLPNIVILYADDLGYGDLSCQNPESRIPTPSLDRLARDGMRFTDAHSSSGVCTPSRYALLTGRYHWRKFHGIVDSFGGSVFDEARVTLPELLRTKGYATACFGKWHLGWGWEAIKRPGARPEKGRRGYRADAFDWSRSVPDGPLDHGFDRYFGDDVPNFPPYTWIENDRVLEAPTVRHVPVPRPKEGSPECRPGPAVPDWRLDAVMPELTRRAVEYLASRRGAARPFFLYFAFTSPHAPIVPTAKWQDRTKAGPYGDFVAQTDDTVRQVLEALEANGHADRTIVIFSSDNGPEAYAYERVRRVEHRSMHFLRGVKRDIYEGGHRVPMIVRWPGRIEAGQVSDALLSQIDIYATLAEVVGTAIGEGQAEDSISQLPLWLGRGPGARTSLVHNTRPNAYALREGDWFYLDAATGHHSKCPQWFAEAEGFSVDEGPALYDLRVDPRQRENRAEEHPGKVRAMKALLAAIRRGKAP
jgi:arylsulfatase A